MNALIALCRQLAGLVVDDGSLALAIVGVIALAAVLGLLLPDYPRASGAVLLLGCLGVLFANVVSAARRKRSS
jgi:hypothetical protein